MTLRNILVSPFIPAGVTILLWSAHVYLRSIWDPGSPYRLLVTVLLVLSFGWVVFVHVRALMGADEYYKQVHCRAMAVAFPVSLVLLFALGFFRAEGFFSGADSRDLPMVLLVTYVIGLTASYKHYQ
ncbi:MAG TPA: hypothetical protein VLH08_10575 [Acidobacteriota bacterium]|nr:hypothetical protein [Acidobacteriota bacterium]